jgi:hypothetical protein
MSDEARPALWSVVAAAHARFPDLDVVAPGGILDVPGPFSEATRLRVSRSMRSRPRVADSVAPLAPADLIRLSHGGE